MAFTLVFSTDLPGVTVFELRQIAVAINDAAGSITDSQFTSYNIVISQTSKTYVFSCDRFGSPNAGIVFPDGLDLFSADGDTVTITVNMSQASNAATRYCFIRGIVRKF
jgi:hypothetical protein